MGVMTSQLRLFIARLILCAFVVSKLILLFTTAGWMAQSYSIKLWSQWVIFFLFRQRSAELRRTGRPDAAGPDHRRVPDRPHRGRQPLRAALGQPGKLIGPCL